MDLNVLLTMMKMETGNYNSPRLIVSPETLYDAMAREADGFYRQITTICTAFLGGILVFLEKLFTISPKSIIYLIVLGSGVICLILSLAAISYVRWQNVEAHRHALKYFKTEDKSEYNKAMEIPERSRIWTKIAIFSMILGIFLITIFVGASIIYKQDGG